MKKITAFCCFLLLSCCTIAAIYPKTKPKKPLTELTTVELNQLFDEVNLCYKKQALQAFGAEMATRLNGTMLVAKGEEVLLKGAAGYQKLTVKRADQRIADSTCFELASVSKQFTAMAILQLISKKQLSLSDPLNKFFPEFPYSGITVHHLLTHTSGLPEYFNMGETAFVNSKNLITNNDIIRLLARRKLSLVFRTGTQYKYTNTNYMLLASIVEKVSKIPFDEYVQANIFKPAGMKNSFYVTQRAKRTGVSIASGHYKDGAPLPLYYLDGTIGDKGVYSNIYDLFLWKKALFNDYKIVPEEWVEAATLPQNVLKNGRLPDDLYGYGFHLEDSKSYGMLVYHGGMWRGFHHIMLYYPQEDIFMVFLSNYYNRAHRGKNIKVLQILCGI